MDFNEFTIFDIFAKKNKIIESTHCFTINLLTKNEFLLYIICSINNEPVETDKLDILINDNKLCIFDNIIKDAYEPIQILIYKLNENTINQNDKLNQYYDLKVKYKNNIQDFNFQLFDSVNNFSLTLTTLFKNDYNLFPIFYDYYKNQGVEHFYLYYNGSLKNIPENYIQIFDKTDVTLIEWDFRYYNNDVVEHKNDKYCHHAQLGQMHHALYKYGKGNCKYMIFNDFDEYFHIENDEKLKIKDYILKNDNIDRFGFCNCWSRTFEDKLPDKFPEKIYFSKMLEHGDRSKNIYKVDSVNYIGIHGFSGSTSFVLHSNSTNLLTLENFKMFHFFKWTNKERSNDIFSQCEYIYDFKTNKYTKKINKKKLLVNSLYLVKK